jgi:hypothetical protein
LSPLGDEVYGAVMTHVYPLMKDTFSLVEHVDFFVEMTIVALDTNRPEFQSLFTYFCLDDKVNPRYFLSEKIVVRNDKFTACLP